jgi:DNA-binding GntR family transcriptional regulator
MAAVTTDDSNGQRQVSARRAASAKAPAVTTESRGNAELAYMRIRQAIVEGKYLPGQRLIEQRVGEEIGLSRTPVREAFRRLEAEGLLTSELNRGATVRDVSEVEIRDIYQLRSLLEGLVAERAAERATPELSEELRASAVAFEAAIPPGEVCDVRELRRLSEANAVFHSTLLRMADHRRLSQILGRTVDIPLVFQAFRQFDRSERVRSAMFHHLIADAVSAGEGARAANLMREHILQGRDVLLTSLAKYKSSRDLFSAVIPSKSRSRRTIR